MLLGVSLLTDGVFVLFLFPASFLSDESVAAKMPRRVTTPLEQSCVSSLYRCFCPADKNIVSVGLMFLCLSSECVCVCV